jgi:prepilin-type N-terminal cleavage/methylation domain-containing protein
METNVKLNKNKKIKGFTLIEALIAMLIFALILIFMAQSILLAYKINFLNSIRNTAWEIASNELENIRNMKKLYDVNNDDDLLVGVDLDGDGKKDYGTDCPEPCTTNPTIPECKTTVRVRNSEVTFGKAVKVELNKDVYEVTLTVCTDYKDWRTGKPIEVTLKTIVAGN